MKKPRTPAANGTSRLDVASPGVNFLTKSDKAVLIMTGPPTDAIHGVNRLTRTSCPLSPCLSALFKKISTPSDRHRGMTFRPPWAFCVLGLCRKNVLWDTKFAANNVQKGEYGSIGKNWLGGTHFEKIEYLAGEFFAIGPYCLVFAFTHPQKYLQGNLSSIDPRRF